MADKRSRKIFVNVAVRDLKKSTEFFSALGFDFNQKFTDENAACMVVSDEAFVMLLTEACHGSAGLRLHVRLELL